MSTLLVKTHAKSGTLVDIYVSTPDVPSTTMHIDELGELLGDTNKEYYEALRDAHQVTLNLTIIG